MTMSFLILGVRQADINIAEGKKRARILTSEAYKMEQVNRASGESNAIQVKAEAQAEAIKRVADALETKVPAKPFQYFSFDLNCSLLVVDGLQNGHNAVSVSVAEKYIHAFEQLAKEGNTLILPSNAGDISHMVAQVRNFSYEQAYRQFSKASRTIVVLPQAMTIYKTVGNNQAIPKPTTSSHNHTNSKNATDGMTHVAGEIEEHSTQKQEDEQAKVKTLF